MIKKNMINHNYTEEEIEKRYGISKDAYDAIYKDIVYEVFEKAYKAVKKKYDKTFIVLSCIGMVCTILCLIFMIVRAFGGF